MTINECHGCNELLPNRVPPQPGDDPRPLGSPWRGATPPPDYETASRGNSRRHPRGGEEEPQRGGAGRGSAPPGGGSTGRHCEPPRSTCWPAVSDRETAPTILFPTPAARFQFSSFSSSFFSSLSSSSSSTATSRADQISIRVESRIIWESIFPSAAARRGAGRGGRPSPRALKWRPRGERGPPPGHAQGVPGLREALRGPRPGSRPGMRSGLAGGADITSLARGPPPRPPPPQHRPGGFASRRAGSRGRLPGRPRRMVWL